MMTPAMVVIAKTRAKNATAMQNRRSVLHQPAIRSVATTDVAHPLTMLTAQVATTVRSLASSTGRPVALRRTVPGAPWNAGGCLGIWVVGDSGTTGMGPVGARRMIRVWDSEGGSGGGGWAAGSVGAVTSTSVVAVVK